MSALASRILDANIRLIRDGETAGISDYFGSRYVVHFGGSKRRGHEVVREFTKTFHNAFSALSVEVETLVQSNDRIAWRRTIRGTQTGAFQGFPASGLKIVWRDMVVSRFEGELIVEEWVVTDLAEQLLRSRKR